MNSIQAHLTASDVKDALNGLRKGTDLYRRNATQAIHISGWDSSTRGIHLTAFFGLQDLTMLLIAMGEEPDTEGSSERTPLWWAARNGHIDLVKALLDTKRVDIDGRIRGIAGPAAITVPRPLFDTLVVDARDEYMCTPLSIAAENGHEAVVKMLLNTGKADTNRQDSSLRTPLFVAAVNGHERVVKALLAYGATDIHFEDTEGHTALDRARRGEHETVKAPLVTAGASAASDFHNGASERESEHLKRKEQLGEDKTGDTKRQKLYR